MTRLARFAWFVLLFNVGVILVGAWVRATGSGAGCGRSWPTCQGELVPELEGATAIEFSHRFVAGISLILVALLAWLVFRELPKGHRARRAAIVALAASVAEALIGAVLVLAELVAGDDSVARAVTGPLHLINTLLLLAGLTLAAFWLSGGRPLDTSRDPKLMRWIVAGGIALVLIAASGAVTALADTLFPKGDPTLTQESILSNLRVIHPVLAVFSTSVAWWASRRVDFRSSPLVTALPVLVGAMLVTGSLNVLLGVPVWMQLVHLLLADALWIVYVMVSATVLQVPAARTQAVG